MVDIIYNKLSDNMKKLVDYVENPKEYSFNESSEIVRSIYVDELNNDKYYNKDLNEFNIDDYPNKLELLVLLNVKDVILNDNIYAAYQKLKKFYVGNKKELILSPVLQYWISQRQDINRVICKAIREVNITINELYENIVEDILQSEFLSENQELSIDFIFSLVNGDNFNFEVYKKIREPRLFKKATLGSRTLDKISEEKQVDKIFESYLIEKLETNDKSSKYFLQKYDYWIAFYCNNIKRIGTDSEFLKTTKLSYILKIYNDICNATKFNINKTKTAKVLSDF